MRTIENEQDIVRDVVREHYGKVATRGGGCGCAPTCCTPEQNGKVEPLGALARQLGYSASETSAVPEGANLGLGCGNPIAIASLQAGQTVLDLGSGAGFDAFLAAHAVGARGLVIGVDMTPEMITKARENKKKGNYTNVEFRLGEIEHLPVADASVDVILSNCVINLSPDKAQVYREAFRVLKPDGRLAVSDILATAPMPPDVKSDLDLYAGCLAGASLLPEVENFLVAAGFSDIRIQPKNESRKFIQNWFPGRAVQDYIVSTTIEARKP